MPISVLAQSPALLALKRGWDWWLSELKAVLPHSWAERRGGVPCTKIRLGQAGVEIERIVGAVGERLKEDRPIEEHDDDCWEQLRALIAGTRPQIELQFPDVWSETLTLPKAALGHLRSAVGLHLLRSAPLDPGELEWGYQLTATTSDRITVLVAMAARKRLNQLAALFESHGLSLPPVYASDAGAAVRIREGDEGEWAAERSRNKRAALISAALLATSPIVALGAAQALIRWDEGRSDELADALRPELARAHRAVRNEDLRLALRPIAQLPSISETIEELATRLPVSAHLVRAQRAADRRIEFETDSADTAETIAGRLGGARHFDTLEIVDQSAREERIRTVFAGRIR